MLDDRAVKKLYIIFGGDKEDLLHFTVNHTKRKKNWNYHIIYRLNQYSKSFYEIRGIFI